MGLETHRARLPSCFNTGFDFSLVFIEGIASFDHTIETAAYAWSVIAAQLRIVSFVAFKRKMQPTDSHFR